MLRFSRSDASADGKPRIVDGTAAKAWLAGLSQPSSLAALGEITDVLLTLGARGAGDGSAPPVPQQCFVIAERIRGVLLPVLHERGADEQLSALPLDDDFARGCWAAVDAAAALRDAYAWLVSQLSDAPPAPDAPLTGATVPGAVASTTVTRVAALQRALDVDAQLLTFVQRARWPVPTAFWERHCVLGQLVRDLDCQDVEVVDALRIGITKTCRAAFVTPVLVALADPAARTAVELQVVRMAAQRWSAKVGFRLERRSDGVAAPARPVANPGPTIVLGNFVLRLDTQSAMQSIDGRLDALAAGRTPREVGIGDSLRPPAARDLLVQLRQRWGAVAPADIDSPERAWRASGGTPQVLAVVGMPRRDARRDGEALGPGRNGSSTYAYQREHHRGITRPREAIESDRLARILVGAETWTLMAESADAVRCVRKYARPRVGLQRLIGLKLGGDGAVEAGAASPFLLGWVEALQGTVVEDTDGRVRSGGAHRLRVRLAPGLPQIVDAAVDGVDLDCAFLLTPRVDATAGRPRAPAFVPMPSETGVDLVARLPGGDADPWTSVRTSPRDHALILPLATFRPQRVVKAGWRGVPVTLRLDELMMRGTDFDLVRFVVA